MSSFEWLWLSPESTVLKGSWGRKQRFSAGEMLCSINSVTATPHVPRSAKKKQIFSEICRQVWRGVIVSTEFRQARSQQPGWVWEGSCVCSLQSQELTLLLLTVADPERPAQLEPGSVQSAGSAAQRGAPHEPRLDVPRLERQQRLCARQGAGWAGQSLHDGAQLRPGGNNRPAGQSS